MTPQTLDDVIARLEEIIQYSKTNNDRAGYFAALYQKVTYKVKEWVSKGEFANNQNLAQLDVAFANRYFEAYDLWKNGKPTSKSWAVAFENCKLPSRLVLQHLLLGMNAHINFDLGIATVQVSNGKPDDLKNDFDSINLILSSLTNKVTSELNVVSPLLSFLGFSGTKSNFMLVQFSMENARDGAWCFAEDLARLTPSEDAYSKFIAQRDEEIGALGDSLTKTTGLMTFGMWLIHLFEWKNVKRIVDMLSSYSKPYKWDMKI